MSTETRSTRDSRLFEAVLAAMAHGMPHDRIPIALLALTDIDGNEISGLGYRRQHVVFAVSQGTLINCSDVVLIHSGAPYWKRILDLLFGQPWVPGRFGLGWIKRRVRTAWPTIYGYRLYTLGNGEEGMFLIEGTFSTCFVVSDLALHVIPEGVVGSDLRVRS